MALELMPNGTFKKLNATQTNALDRYYKRQKEDILEKTLPSLISTGVPIIIGTAIGAIAYIFRDKIKEELADSGEELFKFVNKGIWRNVVFPVMDSLPIWKDPKTPEMVLLNPDDNPRDYRYAGPLTRCKRWETDLVEIESKNGGGIDRAYVLRMMKNEKCSKPAFVESDEWTKL